MALTNRLAQAHQLRLTKAFPPLIDDLPAATCVAHAPTLGVLAPPPSTPPPAIATNAKELEVLVGTPGDGHELGTMKDGTPSSLHLVVDAPYQSWAGEGTFVHVLALDRRFRPAHGAEVFLDGRHIGTMDANGTLAYRRRRRAKRTRSPRVDSSW